MLDDPAITKDDIGRFKRSFLRWYVALATINAILVGGIVAWLS